MDGATTPVNIILHGLFFMRLNTSNNNLEVLAPDIKDHHFVGGPRGSRVVLTDKLIDRTTDLTGKQGDPKPDTDIPGSVFQFQRKDTDIKVFASDRTFKGKIVLPWPKTFYALRTDDITNSFPYDSKSKVGLSIELNARRKGSSTLGAVTLLQYTMQGAGSLQNIHYYNQPCVIEQINDVNADFDSVKPCFSPATAFDLKLRTDATIVLVDPSGNAELGTTPEDEMALYEDPSPDAVLICPPSQRVKLQPSGDPGTSPANCPTIFVG